MAAADATANSEALPTCAGRARSTRRFRRRSRTLLNAAPTHTTGGRYVITCRASVVSAPHPVGFRRVHGVKPPYLSLSGVDQRTHWKMSPRPGRTIPAMRESPRAEGPRQRCSIRDIFAAWFPGRGNVQLTNHAYGGDVTPLPCAPRVRRLQAARPPPST